MLLFPYRNRMLRAMLDEMGPSSHRQFPNVRRIVAAFTAGGAVSKDASADICQWLFPCFESELEASNWLIACFMWDIIIFCHNLSRILRESTPYFVS